MKKILLASVLKPVTDPRMYERIGRTLAEKEEFEVHIAGSAASIPPTKKIIFHPLYKFTRLSSGRFFAPLVFFSLLTRVKPDMIIVCTHELLAAAVIFKWITGAKVIYDVQENYQRNILYMGGWPSLIKWLLAYTVRLKEKLFHRWLNACFLAEKVYLDEMPYLKEKALVLENTFSPPDDFKKLKKTVQKAPEFPTLIISGTIAEAYGIWDGIDFSKRFLGENGEGKLMVCGHVPDENLYKKLKDLKYPWLRLDISLYPVEHQAILECIASSHLALLPYHVNKATAGKIPTKFFEYMALQVPMVIQKNRIWENYLEPYQSALFIDFRTSDASRVKELWEQQIFYPEGVKKKIYWHKNGRKLLNFLETVL